MHPELCGRWGLWVRQISRKVSEQVSSVSISKMLHSTVFVRKQSRHQFANLTFAVSLGVPRAVVHGHVGPARHLVMRTVHGFKEIEVDATMRLQG